MLGRSVLVLLCLASLAYAGPAEAVKAAAADLATIVEHDRHDIRYLTDYAIDKRYRGNFERILRFHVNSLSREWELVNPVIVAPEVYRIRLSDYGWKADVYERLLQAEPYFNARIEVKTTSRRTGKRIVKQVIAAASWLPAEEMAFLIQETGSQVPILRAEWFWSQTVVQEQRIAGYYDFLGLKNRNDYFKLVGLNKAKARERRREVAAIIRKSGVAQHNRQVFRYGAVDSGVWSTLDAFDTETGRRNALSKLDADYQHDAEEHYGFLPNGLFAYYLSEANGTQQNTAPDKIGADTTSTSKDGRIHAYLSCVRCHVEGLRPLDDYARKLYTAPVVLGSQDKAVMRRLTQLYLSDLQRSLVKDVQEFEFHLMKLTGWNTRTLSLAYRDWWDWFNDQDVTVQRAAEELGCTPEALRASLARQGLPPPFGIGQLDLTLATFVAEPSGGMNREHWEEVFQKAALIVRGGAVP